MAAISGKNGYLIVGSCTLLEFKNGNLEYGSEPQEYFSRAGAGAGQTVDGPESGRGSFTANFDPDDPVSASLVSGTLYTIQFVHRETGAVIAQGSARLGKPSFTIDRAGVPQEYTYPFVTHGAWTMPT